MQTLRDHLRNYWAKSFPEVSDQWQYWWLEGDGYCIGVIPGDDLLAAIDFVEDSWEKFDSIKAHKAKVVDKDLIRKDRATYEISNRDKSRQVEENYKAELEAYSSNAET